MRNLKRVYIIEYRPKMTKIDFKTGLFLVDFLNGKNL